MVDEIPKRYEHQMLWLSLDKTKLSEVLQDIGDSLEGKVLKIHSDSVTMRFNRKKIDIPYSAIKQYRESE